MPAAQDTFSYRRSRLALLVKNKAPQQEIDNARRELHEARLRDYIEATLAKAPPLTDAQRDRLATLLRPSAGGAK